MVRKHNILISGGTLPTVNPSIGGEGGAGYCGQPGTPGFDEFAGTARDIPANQQERADEAMNYLMAKGYTKEQSAAIVGNFMQESGMNPNAYNAGEGAYGLAQWRGSRRTGLESFAASRGQSYSDFYTQLDYFDYESRNTEARAGNQIRSATTLNEALAGMRSYERYGHAGARARLCSITYE